MDKDIQTENQPATAVVGQVESSVMQHTPGPWAVCIDPPNAHWHSGLTIGAADPKDARRVCDVTSFESPPALGSMAAANARLIAAAPDLLNALRSLLRQAERMQEVMDEEHGIRFRDDGPMSMARDALRLAFG